MYYYTCLCVFFFFFKQKTAYEMRISDWSSDVCSSDLVAKRDGAAHGVDDILVQAQVADDGQGLRSEGFVQLYPADLIQRKPGQLQRMRNGFFRPYAHDFRRHALDGKRDETRDRRQILRLECAFGHHQHGTGAIGNLRTVSGGDAAPCGKHRAQRTEEPRV